MNQNAFRYFRPAVLVFLVVSIFIFLMKDSLTHWGFQQEVMLYGNLLLFIACLISFFMGASGLQSHHNPAFFRWVYGSFMVKLIFLVTVAVLYILSVKKNINKPGLFFCMGLYIVYTLLEVSGLMKLAKQKKNA